MALKITGIVKIGGADNPHEAISAYRCFDDQTGMTKLIERPVAVSMVKRGTPAYVIDAYGHKAYCKINVSPSGTEFLQTNSDNIWTDNLLALQNLAKG